MQKKLLRNCLLIVFICLFVAGTGACSAEEKTSNFLAQPSLIGGSDYKKKNNVLSEQFDKKNFDLTNLEQAISYAIILTNDTDNKSGECYAEGHKILDKTEKDGKTIVCVQVEEGYLGFKNGIFTCVSGSAIPSQLTFVKNKDGEYELKSYKIPMDGTDYGPTLKKIFTKKALGALEKIKQGELYPQLEEYGKKHLKSIGRDAKVQWDYVEEDLPNLKAEVSNELSEKFSEYPYWIGNYEMIVDGKRIIYTHLWEPDNNGGGIATYKKEIYGGELLEEHVIKVEGDTYTIINSK